MDEPYPNGANVRLRGSNDPVGVVQDSRALAGGGFEYLVFFTATDPCVLVMPFVLPQLLR